MSTKIQFRRDTAANWVSVNPTLSQGELGLETDTGAYKIGDGTTAWNSLLYFQLSPAITVAILAAQSSDPSAPSAGFLDLYSKTFANRGLPKFQDPNGGAYFMQPHLARSQIMQWIPPGNLTNIPGITGYPTPTTVGTATARNVAVANRVARQRRIGYVSSAGAGGLASFRVSATQITIGDGAGNGGFTKVMRFAISDAVTVAQARMFMGICSSVSAPTNVDPAGITNCIGLGHGSGDANMHLYYGGSAAQTPIDLGANFPANTLSADLYELALYAPPNSGDVWYEVTRVNTGDVVTGHLTGTAGVVLPANTTLLAPAWGFRCNNTTALAVGLDIVSDYVETYN